MTIKEHLDRLTPEQLKQLQYAFEQQFSQYVEVGDGFFMGVNISYLKNLEILESAGVWAYGRIIDETSKV